jgi:hypothetical protein
LSVQLEIVLSGKRERTWVLPLHAIGKFFIVPQVVAAPARVGNDDVCGGDASEGETEYC